ncbi:MAG: DUF2442 domain-containing protein [Gammaproteobacteria bacterium]|nr:DUF2442 domain-containing protein [Gammaproteobacteria bacterium]
MSTLPTELPRPVAVGVEVSAATLTVLLADGRSISVPLSWYPRLANGSMQERARWELIGSGQGIHWPDLDEDIEVGALLAGKRSNETASAREKSRSIRRRGDTPLR